MEPIALILGIGSKLIDKLFPDPEQKAAAQLELFKLQQTGELAKLTAESNIALAQADINKEEAKSDNVFVAGWRPAVGWVCALAFGAKFLVGPLLVVVAQMYGKTIILPDISMTDMMPVLFGMLGLGALRTIEKVKQ